MKASSAIFLGSKAFGLSVLEVLLEAEPSLDWIVMHPEDSSDGRSCRDDFEKLCSSKDIPLEVVKAKTANERICELSVDVVFVCGWYALIPAEVLDCRSRFLGIHNSLLPKYRGGAPLVWALINDERNVGSSLFEIGRGMDDGRVFYAVETDVTADDSIASVSDRIERAWHDCLPLIWREFVAGCLDGKEQDHAKSTFAAQRRPEDGRIDWNWPAQRVHNFIRAQTRPYPGAFTGAEGKLIRIWKATPHQAVYDGTPGQVVERREDRVVVACGQRSALVIQEASDNAGTTDLIKLFPGLSLRL